MAYNNNSPRAEYTASASQTVFPFLFKIFTEADIKVYQTPVGQEPDDTADLLTLTTDYTVTINGDAGGEITLVSGATNGDKITLLRSLEITRNIEYQNQGDLTAATLNLDQEYQTYLIADREAIDERFIKLSENAQGVNNSLPAPAPDTYIKWNSAANALENDITIPQAVTTSAANAAAAAASATQAQLREWEAEADALTALSYASEAEDVLVNLVTSDGDGTFTYTPQAGVYSSKHHQLKAEASAISIDPTVLLHTLGDGAGNPEGYTSAETDAQISNRVVGLKNLLHNPNKTIQQRGTTGGKRQVIDASNIELGGSYVISFTGTATVRIYEATTLGTSDALTTWAELTSGASISGTVVTVTAGKYIKVEFSTTDFSFAQFEKGTIPTSFEQRAQLELSLCLPYYEQSIEYGQPLSAAQNGIRSNTGTTSGGAGGRVAVQYKATKRIVPTISVSASDGTIGSISYENSNGAIATTSAATVAGNIHEFQVSFGTGYAGIRGSYSANAEHFTDTYYEDRWF